MLEAATTALRATVAALAGRLAGAVATVSGEALRAAGRDLGLLPRPALVPVRVRRPAARG